VQPELARTIQRLADMGGEDFYTGEIGGVMAQDMARHGGFITAEDLRDYTVDDEQMFHGSYHGLTVTSAPEIIEMLQILDHFDLRNLGHNSPDYVDTFARIQRATFADYAQVRGADLDETRWRMQEMTDPARAAYWATRIKRGDRIALRGGAISAGTTHLTCVDTDHNVVGLNHSIGSAAGSGAVTPGLGFLYNNFLGHFNPLPGQPDSIAPRKRLSDIISTIVFRDGEPYIAIGSPGGSRLITSMVQCIVNVIDWEMDMRTAVTVPRFHSEQEQLIFLEPQFPERTAQALRSLGNDVRRSTYMARVQAILRRPDTGELEAGADPRGGAGVGCYPPCG
jgi:gamma-glutamyltranspeptidase/glutathione hydrolase